MESRIHTTRISALSDDSAYIESGTRSNEASSLTQQDVDPTNRICVQNESVWIKADEKIQTRGPLVLHRSHEC